MSSIEGSANAPVHDQLLRQMRLFPPLARLRWCKYHEVELIRQRLLWMRALAELSQV